MSRPDVATVYQRNLRHDADADPSVTEERVPQDQLLIVYSGAANVFYEGLARRLAEACKENSWEVSLRAASELNNVSADRLRDATLVVVNPSECSYRVGDAEGFFSRLSAARKRVMILAEAIENKWFEAQFRLPVRYDLLIDVGFTSQREKLSGFDVPYRFLFNGPTLREELMIQRAAPSERRHIPWAFVGHSREDRSKLAAELVERLDPSGFVFLPNPGTGMVRGTGKIGPSGLASVLSKTRYYIWRSHHEFMYYESFRFIEALLAGAVPCKIDNAHAWKELGIPWIFPSVQSLCGSVRSEGFASMQDSAREFYLSRGRLADHVKEVLGDV